MMTLESYGLLAFSLSFLQRVGSGVLAMSDVKSEPPNWHKKQEGSGFCSEV